MSNIKKRYHLANGTFLYAKVQFSTSCSHCQYTNLTKYLFSFYIRAFLTLFHLVIFKKKV